MKERKRVRLYFVYLNRNGLIGVIGYKRMINSKIEWIGVDLDTCDDLDWRLELVCLYVST